MTTEQKNKRLGISIDSSGFTIKVDSEKYDNHKPYRFPWKKKQ